MPVINLEQITFESIEKTIISELSLTIPENETLIFAGAGESGRSVLLQIIAGILAPTNGRVLYDDIDIYDADLDQLKEIKRQIGFSFQHEGLLSNLTIEENVLLPVKFFDSEAVESYFPRINELLDFFSIKDTWKKRPAELSIQKKKILVFIRSIIMNPKILFIDDPYFSLDQFYQNRILESLIQLKERGLTLVIITNSNEIMNEIADRILFFREGKVEREIKKEQITPETLKIMENMFIRS
jgi:ABC-type methionine transport system ATPase subunit